MTNISLGILLALHEHKEIHGTDELAAVVGTLPRYVTPAALMLSRFGMIEMQIGSRGRGHKTIYRDKGVITVNKDRAHAR